MNQFVSVLKSTFQCESKAAHCRQGGLVGCQHLCLDHYPPRYPFKNRLYQALAYALVPVGAGYENRGIYRLLVAVHSHIACHFSALVLCNQNLDDIWSK